VGIHDEEGFHGTTGVVELNRDPIDTRDPLFQIS
jgi:hypothetical protein